MKIEDVSRFSKTVYRYNDFSVKHTVNVINYTTDLKTKKEIYKSPVYTYDIMDKKIMESRKGITFSFSDSIILANNEKNPVSKVSPFISIRPEMFRQIKNILDLGVDWLVKDEYAKYYTVDVQGNTTGISNSKVVSIERFPLSWLMIKPAVLFIKEVGYQGIYLKCDRGILGTLPAEEYIAFVRYMKELMNNFYGLSLQLYNTGLLTLLLGSSNESISK